MHSIEEHLRGLKSGGIEITPDALDAALRLDVKPLVVDVREKSELQDGFLSDSLSIPRGFLELQMAEKLPNKARPVVVYCAGGTRSLLAAQTLKNFGYENVRSLEGGFRRWKEEGHAFELPLLKPEADRYARHLAIPEVGAEGQAKLLRSKVLIVGMGGLGSPVAYYLAAAGVGTLGLLDYDRVEESNLQRQILHTPSRVGQSKVSSAQRTLLEFNPSLNFVPHEGKLNFQNAGRILEAYDLIVDGSDNFSTRYLVNDTCFRLQKPFVHGSVLRFSGQVSVFVPANGSPCYRCLYPAPPPKDQAPNCAEAGVLGVLPGLVGMLQALEAVKLLLNLGQTLEGRLLAFEGLETKFREYRYQKDPDCVGCAREELRFPPDPSALHTPHVPREA